MSQIQGIDSIIPPAEWKRDKLARLCEFVGSGGTPSSSNPDFYGGGIPWVQTGDLNDARLSETSKTITEEGLHASPTRLYPPSTLLMAMYGATIGKLSILQIEAAVNQACCAMVLRNMMDVRFMFYKLFTMRSELIAAGLGGGQQNIGQETIKQSYLTYPRFGEQQRIAAYLDASCAAIDAAVAAKGRQLETLDALRTTLIYEGVTRGINSREPTVIHDIPSYGPTPKHWKRSKLRYEISIQNGDFASDKLQDDGTHPIFGGNGVMGHTDLSNVDGQTVVIGRVGAYCGNAHYVQGKAWVSDNALIVKSLHYARFLCHLFNALNFNAQANNTAQPVITGTKIKNTYVVLPPPAEQEAICAFLDAKLADVKRTVTNIETQINTLVTYRKSLIHECVTGQRRIMKADLYRVKAHG